MLTCVLFYIFVIVNTVSDLATFSDAFRAEKKSKYASLHFLKLRQLSEYLLWQVIYDWPCAWHAKSTDVLYDIVHIIQSQWSGDTSLDQYLGRNNWFCLIWLVVCMTTRRAQTVFTV